MAAQEAQQVARTAASDTGKYHYHAVCYRMGKRHARINTVLLPFGRTGGACVLRRIRNAAYGNA